MTADPRPPAQPTFESRYVDAGEDLASIPWARLEPNPQLVSWLDQLGPSAGARGLSVGCGLGDDAEELSRRGLETIAFDFSPTAIARCHERFPDSAVQYVVADVFDLPAAWRRSFDVIEEIRTLQSLDPGTREPAVRAIGELLAPGGRLLVVAYGREDDRRPDHRPWPVSRRELRGFLDAGLAQHSFADEPINDAGDRTWTIVYERSEAWSVRRRTGSRPGG